MTIRICPPSGVADGARTNGGLKEAKEEIGGIDAAEEDELRLRAAISTREGFHTCGNCTRGWSAYADCRLQG